MSVNIGINDFKRIRQIAKKSNCKIKIVNKKGIPFLFNRYRKRKIFLIMLLIIIAVIYVSSNFIWNIEINGIAKINYDEILYDLEECGLKIGMIKNKIDTKEIVNNIRLKRKDIAWIGIDLKGTNANVNVVEATERPEIIKEDEYCNIIANKKGVITKINALNGTALAKVR